MPQTSGPAGTLCIAPKPADALEHFVSANLQRSRGRQTPPTPPRRRPIAEPPASSKFSTTLAARKAAAAHPKAWISYSANGLAGTRGRVPVAGQAQVTTVLDQHEALRACWLRS